jgi:thiol-disulfide isomerase/thioredoxin
MKYKLLVLSGIVLFTLASAFAGPMLKVGDPAPELKVAKWFKGEPVEKFSPGSIYVVEFWATWCGPCKESIPHLTELARQYDGKARIVGVSIWESEKNDHAKRLDGVGKFVTRMGDKMNYSVAADDNDFSMAKNWMEAAGENGIPTAFVIGKDGKIAWIGYPWQLDKVLEQTVAGTLDTKAVLAEDAKRQADKGAKAKVSELLKPVSELQQSGKPQEAVAALDKVIADHPELAAKTEYLRYKLLLAYDEPAAYKQVRKLLEGEWNNNPGGLYSIGRDLTDPPGRKTPDWDLAVTVAERAAELKNHSDPNTLSVLAAAYFGKGETAKAVETGEQAVNKAEADTNYPEGSKTYIKRRVEHYKAALEKNAPQAATPGN